MAADSLIEMHIAALRASGAAETTIKAARGVFQRAGADPVFEYGVEVASDTEIIDYLGREGWSPKTRNIYHYHLSTYFRWAAEHGYIEFDPMAKIKAPKVRRGVPRPVTNDELAAMLTHGSDALYLIAMLAAYAGLRCCEIARLRREDVTAKSIYVVGKGGALGVVDTCAEVWTIIEPMGPGMLIEQVGGKSCPRWVSNRTKYECRKLGMPTVSAHRLRHWHATGVYAFRGDILSTASALRHSSVETAQIYTLVDNPQRRAAVDALPIVGPRRRLAAG